MIKCPVSFTLAPSPTPMSVVEFGSSITAGHGGRLASRVVVLSGTLYFGSGDKWDESKFKTYPAGTFYSEPSKAPHFTWAKDGEVIIQITGVGPSGKTFIPQ
jgi:hypothetical protein